jgi:hypothetical protein
LESNMAQEWWLEAKPVTPGRGGFVPAPGVQEEQARRAREEGRAEAGEARAERGEARDISKSEREVIGEFRKEFLGNPEVKSFRDVANATRQILALSQREGSAMGDMGLIFSYMKALDPDSTVRETEQASARNAAGVPDRIRNLYNKALSGEDLNPAQRADMAETALAIYDSRAQSYNTFANTYRGLITDAGGDPDKQGITLAPQLRPVEIPLGEQPPSQAAPKVPGQAFVTPEDLARRDQVQAAWDRGATPEEIVALTARLGLQPPSADDLAMMRNAREKNLPMSFLPNPTGQPSAVEGAIGQFMSTPVGEAVGGYSIGTLNALTGGFAVPEEIKQFTRETAPVSSSLGEATGAGIAAIPAIRGAQGILAGTRLAGAAPLIGESAYGALYGAGEAGEGNRLTGAALGGVGGLVGGALINRFLPGGPGTFTGAPRAPAAPTGRFGGAAATPEDIIVAGQQANIPVMTSDIMPPTTRMEQTLRNLGEVAPLGMGVPRVRQQAARQEAVENLLSDFGVTVDADIASDVVRNLNENRANMLSRFNSQKDGVINKFANAGDVPTTRSVAAIDKLLVDLRSENLPQLNSLIKDLEGVRDSLTGPGNLPKIEANRSTIFTLKGDPNLASISTKAENAFTAVYNALNDDMGEFIKATGGNKDFALWKTANTQLAQMVGELKVGGLAGALKKGEFDPNIVTKMLVSSKPEEVRMLFRNLNREGRENARLLLIQEAGKRAFNSDTQMLNPDKFAREIGNLSDNFGKFFNASDMRRVQGLTDVLRATSRAQSARFLPQTGAQLLPFGAAGSLTAIIPGMGVMEGAAAATAFGVGRRFYESKFARDLLLRISQASGSKKAELINQFVAGATAATAARGAVGMAGAEEQ